MPRRKKVSGSGVLVPTTLGEASRLVRQVGARQRTLRRSEASLNGRIERMKRAAEAKAKRVEDEIKQRVAALLAFYRAHPELVRKSRTITVPAGQFSLHLTQPALLIEGDEQRVVAALKRLRGGRRYVRVTERVNRNELKKAPLRVLAKLPGVSVGQGEVFTVKPARSRVTVTESIEALAKVSVGSKS